MNWQNKEIPYEESKEMFKLATRGASKIHVKRLEKLKILKFSLSNVSYIELLDAHP